MTQNDTPPPYLDFDPATRRLRLDPHEPALRPEPLRSLCLAARASGGRSSGRITASGASAAIDDVNRLLRDRRFGRQNPAGIPDSRGVGQDRVASRRLRRDRGQFDARTRAAGPHAAAHAGQPRLRLAPGRAAAAARRGAGQRTDRPLRAWQARRSAAGLRRAAADHHHRRNARRAGRDGAATARLVASDGRHVHARPHPRNRRRRQPRGARILRFPARLRRRAAQAARRRPAVAADLGAGGRPEALRGRAGLVGHPAAQCRP